MLGTGRLTHKMMLVPLRESYLSLDKFIAHPELDLLADLLKGLPFKDESFDTVFSVLRFWSIFLIQRGH